MIRRAKVAIKSEVFRITNVNKGYLVKPQMGDEPGNMLEHMAQLVQRRATSLAWQKALNEPARRRLQASTAEEYFKAFVNEAERLRSAGLRPVLLVRSPADPLWLKSWLGGPDDARPAEMHIERERASAVGGSGYIRTINGVHLFGGSLEVGTSLLFPRELVSEVTYGEDECGRIVHATFKQSEGSSDPWTGYIEFSFRQYVRLHDQAEVIEIAYPAEAGYGKDAA